ncbi:hypothetical protein SynA1528_00158 [Synechococcus sp. A15-28]|nr:hypothetical protein SynA1528_00158 [Synechococcus sp. A15-28]
MISDNRFTYRSVTECLIFHIFMQIMRQPLMQQTIIQLLINLQFKSYV